MEAKKISFGFSKVTKRPAFQLNITSKPDDAPKVELIKCLEGQEIKLVQEKKEAPVLVIPLKDGGKTSAALASLAKRRAVLLGEEDEPVDKKSKTSPTSNGETNGETQSLEKRAETEILADLNAQNEVKSEDNLVLPVVQPDELPLDGAKESNLDDYESIPIGQYGWAMLRGMGAVEPPKSDQKLPIDSGPMQRPPGLGLGADKALKPKPLLEQPETNEKLEIKKQAFVRILAGKHKDCYGQIEGFDHERGTIIVKLAIGNTKQKFQEFLCQAVSKKEYAQYSKCINKAKYEEYKKQENEHGQIVLKREDHVKTKKEEPKKESDGSSRAKTEILDSDKRFKSEEFPKKSNSSRTDRHKSRSRSRSFEMLDSKNVKEFDSRLKSEEFPKTSSSNRTDRYRSRSRSRSSSRSRKHSSRKRNDYDDNNKRSKDKSDSETDRKTKSSRSHVKKTKKKHKRRHSSRSSDSSFSSTSDSSSDRHKRNKKKKSKKKSKKNKKDRRR